MITSTISSHIWLTVLGWTLVHSLWQGAVIAALLAAALRFCREYPARLRYALGVTGLLLWLTAALLTLAAQWRGSLPAAAAAAWTGAVPAESFSLAGLLPGRFDAAAALPLLTLLWLAGVLLMFLRTLAGLYAVYTLKNRDLGPLPREWQMQIGAWFAEWGVRQRIPVQLSGRISAPVVAGFFRQTLLLPLSFLTSFPPEYVQAILAHEVAHLLRRDALVNLLQTLMEILFFYHPVIWWISARIREEREYCCDDYAIARCGEPMLLARALVDLGSRQLTPAASLPVLSAASRLQLRIKRLLNIKENAMDLREKLLALIFILGLGLMLLPLQSISETLLPAGQEQKQEKKIEVKVEKAGENEQVITVVSTDSSGQRSEKILTTTSADSGAKKLVKVIVLKDEGEGKEVIKLRDGKTLIVLPDGKEITPGELQDRVIKVRDGKAVIVTGGGEEIALDDLKGDERGVARWKSADGKTSVFTVRVDGPDSLKKEVKVHVRGHDEAEEDILIDTVAADSVHKQIIVKVLGGDGKQEVWHISGEDGEVLTHDISHDSSRHRRLVRISEEDEEELKHAHGEKIHKEIKIIRESEPGKKDKKERGEVGDLIRKELIKDGIVTAEGAAVDFKLGGGELMVNGVKQPEAACKKYEKILRKSLGLGKDEKIEIRLKFEQKKQN